MYLLSDYSNNTDQASSEIFIAIASHVDLKQCGGSL